MNNRRQMYNSRYSSMRSVPNQDCGCPPAPEPICTPNNNERMEHGCDCKERWMSDPMQGFPLAMAYVPWQKFQKLYNEHEAFQNGTIFKELDLDYYGRRCK